MAVDLAPPIATMSRPVSTEMIAKTTNNSMMVNPARANLAVRVC
jgi:hypothetical protein